MRRHNAPSLQREQTSLFTAYRQLCHNLQHPRTSSQQPHRTFLCLVQCCGPKHPPSHQTRYTRRLASQGKNRLTGMLGALVLEMPLTSTTFEVGTGFTDSERNWIGAKKRWPVGTVISYKYQNLTKKGVPRFPVFLRLRSDKSWAEVISDAQKDIEDKERAARMPSIRRAPSLMVELPPAISSTGGGGASASAMLVPVKRSSSGIMFTEDRRVDAIAAMAVEHPPTRARLEEDAEPRVTRAASAGGDHATVPAATAPAAASGKRKREVDGERPADLARWQEAIGAQKFGSIVCLVGGQRLPLRPHQQQELTAWLHGKWNRSRLHLKDGVPSHFADQKGVTNRIRLLVK